MKRKTGKKLLGILLTLAMVIGLMPGMRLTAYAKSEVKYLDASGTEQSITNYTVVESDTKWRQGWYVVNSDVEINQTNGISFSGDANLILCDGAKLTVTSSRDGIRASRGSLTIYAQSTSDNMGKLEVTSGSAGIFLLKNLTINGGKIETHGSNGISSQEADITINGGNVTADGGIFFSTPNNLTITGGKVIASATGTDSGIYTEGEVIISGGNVSVTGDENPAIDGTVKNSIAGTGWTNKAGTEGKADIAISTGQTLSYKKVQFPADASHTHNFTYSSDGAVITATCSASGCTLTDNKATLTIVKPTLTTYGETGKSADATLTGLDTFNTATSKTIATTDIKYVGRDGTTYTESATAPANAGKYTAKMTVEGKTATVDYEIAKAATSVTTTPTAGEITYGQTLADSTLTGGTASVAGTFAWKNTTIAPAVSDSENTEYDVVFTPTDGNYSTAECKVKLTVNKADPTNTVGQLSAFRGQTLADVALPTAENGVWSWEDDTTTTLDELGMTTYFAKFTPNDTNNYNTLENVSVQIQVSRKQPAVPATVTANNRTYDGTEKPLVTVDESTLVGGTMRYALGTDATTAPDESLYTTSIPAKTDAGTYYVWYKVVGDESHKDTEPKSVTAVIRGTISAAVTFKVVNGSWNDETTADRTVTLTGLEGDTLKLTADQIPAVGSKPADTYKEGAWDVVPSTETAITAATTYTYTYAQKDSISQTVTFKVVNGKWDDETTADKTVPLTGLEGDTLKLTANQIPAVGTKPDDTYMAGGWDVEPSIETVITAATTYTYTYEAKSAAVVTTVPTAKALTYDGTAQELITAGAATGGTMKYAVTTENAPPKDDSLYTETIPTRTDAGTYYVWYKAVGDSTHTDSKPACVTVTIGEKIVYTAAVKTSATVDEHTIGSGEDAVLVFHRSVDDAKTIEHFSSAAVDGKTMSAGDYSIKSGSLILTLKASYLDTLTPGTHQVTATFDDGSADTTITILEAPAAAAPTDVPKTGDGADLGLWLTLMLAGLLLLGGWAVVTIRKHS